METYRNVSLNSMSMIVQVLTVYSRIKQSYQRMDIIVRMENCTATCFIQQDAFGENTAYSTIHFQDIHIQEDVMTTLIFLRDTSH
jgi:hypothetical protein